MHPQVLENFIAGRFQPAAGGGRFEKTAPADGSVQTVAPRSTAQDVDDAVAAARAAQAGWAAMTPVARGEVLFRLVALMEERRADIAAIVAAETGKSPKEALGETMGAIALARFYAGEGQRLYARTLTSGVANKHVYSIRRPCGVAGLISAANTPIANVAWKLFPALICGNAVVMKSAEDTPATADIVARLGIEAGLPAGLFNLVHGLGAEAGAALVEHDGVDVVSFTGSAKVGRWIGEVCGRKLTKVSLELGGKNPLVVCDDADLDRAVEWACLSAFSNAGQRCAAGSRIIVFSAVYDAFVAKLLARVATLKVGPTDSDDFGPVINARQLSNMLAAIDQARADGARVLAGGSRVDRPGFYLEPTVIADVDPAAALSRTELFGPIAALYRVENYDAALALANDSPYGLTACIHTRSLDRAIHFTNAVQAGMAVVNGGTYGSEPHMPFGGVKQSGNGTREPGVEALDIYTELKTVALNVNPSAL